MTARPGSTAALPPAVPESFAERRSNLGRVGDLCGTLTREIRSRLTARMALGAAVETGWVAAHLVTYPAGLLFGRRAGSGHGHRVEHLPPVQRGLLLSDVEAAGTPILLLHGIIDNRSIFALLKRGLVRRGFGTIFAMNYSVLTMDIRAAALRLSEEVEAIVAETGYERIHIVGHSLGGLIARYYVTRLGGDERVHTLVTLGTPHRGTYLAYLAPTPLTKQMRPGSALIRELEEPVPACRTRFLCYWSDGDEIIVPQSNAALTHPDLGARNVRLPAVGHGSLPIVGEVVHGISTALAHLDHAGHTRTEGAIPLHATLSRGAGPT